tara:strand:+ start:789 stop:1190 length:402 start_codon:yes stop_codon:yes gene_type:complete
LVPVVVRVHLEHPPIQSLMDHLELLLLLDRDQSHLVVVEDLLVQMKMVEMVDLVVVHQVVDLLEMVVQERNTLPINQVILVLIQTLKTKVVLVVKEMIHQSLTMALAVVVDSLDLVKVAVLVVVMEVLVLIYQ